MATAGKRTDGFGGGATWRINTETADPQCAGAVRKYEKFAIFQRH